MHSLYLKSDFELGLLLLGAETFKRIQAGGPRHGLWNPWWPQRPPLSLAPLVPASAVELALIPSHEEGEKHSLLRGQKYAEGTKKKCNGLRQVVNYSPHLLKA